MQKIFTHSEVKQILEFECESKWSNLATNVSSNMIKHCNLCHRDVFFCENNDDILKHTKLGNCIAILTDSPQVQSLGADEKGLTELDMLRAKLGILIELRVRDLSKK